MDTVAITGLISYYCYPYNFSWWWSIRGGVMEEVSRHVWMCDSIFPYTSSSIILLEAYKPFISFSTPVCEGKSILMQFYFAVRSIIILTLSQTLCPVCNWWEGRGVYGNKVRLLLGLSTRNCIMKLKIYIGERFSLGCNYMLTTMKHLDSGSSYILTW